MPPLPIERPAEERRIHLLPLQVRLREMVGGWHVHYAEYLHYLEMAATDHIASLGYPFWTLHDRFGGLFMMHRLEIEYLSPARAYDSIKALTWVESVRAASLMRATEILHGETGRRLAIARAQWVWVDTEERAQRMPEELRQVLEAVAGS